MTIPEAFIEQNGLSEGSRVELLLSDRKLTVEAPTCPSYKLAEIMAEMQGDLPKADGWDDMPNIGLERG